MSTKDVTPNLIQVTRLHFVNAYLVREEDGFTLVDTTLGGGAVGDLLGAAERAGAPIRRIAATHGHGDHVGALDALVPRLDGVEVLIPEGDARILAGEAPPHGKKTGSWPKVATKPGVLLKEGDRVGSLEVIATPGHTPGHVSYVDTRDGTIIAGDAVTTYGRVAVTSHFNLRFPFAAMATWDKALAVESAAKLSERKPPVLVAGHGPPVRDAASALAEAVERARR
jgi:glyoxylase-like metal-dependent hydrolase (beta-lactamase superfamily II)